MKPETKKKVIIASIVLLAILASITAFSILAWPRVSINNPQEDELAPKESIRIKTGPLTSIKNIRVEQDGVHVDTYTNPEGFVTLRSYNYDSNYTVYAYVDSTNPFLSVFGIGGKDIKNIRTWTTPKVVNIERVDPSGTEKLNLASPEIDKAFQNQTIKISFSRKMNPGKTSFYLGGVSISSVESVGWENNKIATLKLEIAEEEKNQFTLKMDGKDYEDHPLINRPLITLLTPILEATNELGSEIGTIGQEGYLKVKVGGTINFGVTESNGPFGSSWHSGAKYGDNTLRKDIPTGAILFKIGERETLLALTELSKKEGYYYLEGNPGERVRVFINESPGNYKNNSGTFYIYKYQ